MTINKGRFKKGQIAWNKNKTGYMSEKGRKNISDARQEGEKSSHWLGDKVGYSGLHGYIEKEFKKLGMTKKCFECGIEGNGRKIHLANIGKADRNLKHWRYLCVSHHKIFDLARIKNYKPWNKEKIQWPGGLPKHIRDKISKTLKETLKLKKTCNDYNRTP